MIRDFTSSRLFLRATLSGGASVDLEQTQANYLVNVLRLGEGSAVLVFNGVDGEWKGKLVASGRKTWQLEIVERTRPQTPASDLHYLFAPLKHARLDYMVEKAVEMGAGRLRPVVTRHTQVARVNRERMEANAIQAAEQCGILSVPAVAEPAHFSDVLAAWPKVDPGRRLIFCDEGEVAVDPVAILAALKPSPLAVLVGPEGGFADDERKALRAAPFVTAIPLGPRILRADTAAIAALALVQATLGDWRNSPPAPD
jgi:16S rRNA (uracil1498-N3)-methyltransferase